MYKKHTYACRTHKTKYMCTARFLPGQLCGLLYNVQPWINLWDHLFFQKKNKKTIQYDLLCLCKPCWQSPSGFPKVDFKIFIIQYKLKLNKNHFYFIKSSFNWLNKTNRCESTYVIKAKNTANFTILLVSFLATLANQ